MICIKLTILTLLSFINLLTEVAVSVRGNLQVPATLAYSCIFRENIELEDTIILKRQDKNESILQEANISAAESNGSFWQLEFTGQGLSDDFYSENLHFEVFVNQNLISQIQGNPGNINEILKEYLTKLNDSDVLKLILINHKFSPLKIKTGSKTYLTNDQEVFLYFHSGRHVHYEIDLLNEPSEIVDFYFFYIEKSNGIENLRDVRDRLDPLIDEQKSFLVYFHGPENRALTISHNSDRQQMDDFFNILFTSRTQPPSVPKDELMNVYNELSQIVSKKSQQVDLTLYFYFNEASYSFLLNPFITPLLESRIPQLNLMKWHATILTDFNISNKNENHTYINIW